MGFPELSLHEWSALRGELVWAYDRTIGTAPNFTRTLRARRGSGHWAWLLRAGTLRFEHAASTINLRAGSWLFLPMGESVHSFSKNAHLLSVHFHHAWPTGDSFIQADRPLVIDAAQRPELELRARKLAALIAGRFPSVNHHIQSAQKTTGQAFLHLQAHFSAWLESWLDACLAGGLGWNRLRTGDDRILTIIRTLNAAPLARPFPRRLLLAQTRLSEIHLTRLFLRATGLTPVKYWDKRRLELARDLLSTSLAPIKEISWRLGFRADTHFTTWFRRKTAFRPTEWRKLAAASPG